MGVRGLTSFIGRRAEQFLKPYELHDSNLIIDGDSLACNLYKDVSECNSAFGGDYDEYYRTVVLFFHILSECNITPFVLLDGGYEAKKMRTVEQRLRNKISVIKHLNPNNSKPMFPLMMRELFVEACKDCNVNVMRCLFEADEEIAALARKLNCPVLSYDSDFYIYNVKYIPMITLTMKVLEKKQSKIGCRNELRKCEAKHLKKRKEMNNGLRIQVPLAGAKKPMDEIVEDENVEDENVKPKKVNKSSKKIKYLDCCMYRIENLIGRNRLSKEKLPLFAAMLGNDYIHGNAFRKFYSQVGMKGIARRKIPRQQKRVLTVLRWLSHETVESATEKIMERMKKGQRYFLRKQMEYAINGYSNEKSDAFEFFGISEEDCRSETSDSDNGDNCLDEVEEDELNENSDNENFSDSENDLELDLNKIDSDEDCSRSNESISELCESELNDKISKKDSENSDPQNEESLRLVEDNKASDGDLKIYVPPKDRIPQNMKKRIYEANLPRYISDFFYQCLYINAPQIENFLLQDANEVALPILIQIFTLLFYPEKPTLRYLTRVIQKTNVFYKKIDISDYNYINTIDFNSAEPNLEPVKECFSKLRINKEILFVKLMDMPEDLQLYFLALIYWMNKSHNCDIIHMKSLLICLTVLRTCDSKVEPIRNEKKFHKKFNKIMQKEKATRAKITLGEVKEVNKIEKRAILLDNLSPYEKVKFIPKTECLLVLENMLKYFHYENLNKKTHTEFSSSIIHGYSEFQAVCLQLYTLNSLCNSPFQHFKLSQLFNGVFLYNIYENLKQRPDINHYIKMHLFKNSEIMFEFFLAMENWIKEFIPIAHQKKVFLSEKSLEISKKRLKKQKQIEKKKTAGGNLKSIGTEDMIEKSENDEDYNDINNQFQELAIK